MSLLFRWWRRETASGITLAAPAVRAPDLAEKRRICHIDIGVMTVLVARRLRAIPPRDVALGAGAATVGFLASQLGHYIQTGAVSVTVFAYCSCVSPSAPPSRAPSHDTERARHVVTPQHSRPPPDF